METLLYTPYEVRYCYLKGEYDKSKIRIINSKATTEVIQQRVIANKPMAKIKWNHEKEQKGNRCEN